MKTLNSLFRQCLTCNARFLVEGARYAARAYYCSDVCCAEGGNIRKCAGCGAKMSLRKNKNAKYCGTRCAPKPANHQSPFPGVSAGTIGAIAELQVCADLLVKGFEVFRAVSPNSVYDLVIAKDGSLWRVEVRTGKLGLKGNLAYGKARIDKCDFAAVVVHGVGIHYIRCNPLADLVL